MGKRYLIDSSIIIKFSSHSDDKIYNQAVSTVLDIINEDFNISIIVKIEVLSKTDNLLSFVNKATVFNLDEAIIEETIKLRRKHKIKLPDAIIAATALTYNFQLLTHNTKDFNHIKGLTVVNPFKI